MTTNPIDPYSTQTELRNLANELDMLVENEPMLKLFRFIHLPPGLQRRSVLFAQLAVDIVNGTPRNAERTVCLRKLRESKDCAITAMLWED